MSEDRPEYIAGPQDNARRQEAATLPELQEVVARFLLRIKYGSLVIKKSDRVLLIEETKQEKRQI